VTGQTSRSPSPVPGSATAGPHLIPLSARRPEALPEVARRLAHHLEAEPAQGLGHLAYTYQVGKTHFPYRTALVAASRAELLEQCRALAGRSPAGRAPATASGERPPRVAFLFSGQGSQYAGMGAELYRASPVFREAIDRCAATLDRLLARPLREILFDRTLQGLVNETEMTQPALFSLEYALARQWMAWGYQPEVVLGHSLGELVAACIAGAFEVEDGCALVYHRGAMMQRLCERGELVSVAAPIEELSPLLEQSGGGATISVFNAADKLVVGGPCAAVGAFCQALEARGLVFRRLSVSHAFHTPMMEPMLAPFAERVAAVNLAPLRIPLISNLDGACLEARTLGAEYWTRQIRSPVRFSTCLEALARRGVDLVIEIGPHPTLARLAEHALQGNGIALSSLHKDERDLVSLYKGLGRIYSVGFDVSWRLLHGDPPPARVHVPTYPFQRKSYSLDIAADRAVSPALEAARPQAPEQQFDHRSDLAAVQERLMDVWREILVAPNLTSDSAFSDLGGDSLDAVRLLARIKQTMQVPMTLEELFKHPTPATAARLVHERLQAGQRLAGARAAPARPPAVERVEPAPAQAPSGMVARVGESKLRRVLLTGATGFLGAHVLRELIEETDAEVHCLVRRREATAAEARLHEALELHLGQALLPSARVHVVAGDLSHERLGLGAQEYATLGAGVDVIIHCAGESLTPAGEAQSVGGSVRLAERLLQFVAEHPRVRLHHISSLEVAGRLPSDDDTTTFTEGDLERGQQLEDPRALAHLQAERLIRAAGGPAVIHRLGHLVGHATTGRAPRGLVSRPLYRALKTMVERGGVATGFGLVDVTPVDHAASAIVALAGRDEPGARTYHICNPRPLEVVTLCERLRALGYSLIELSPESYRQWVGASTGGSEHLSSVRLSCERTRALLDADGVRCPEPDAELFLRLMRYGIEQGFFPTPPHWEALVQDRLGEAPRVPRAKAEQPLSPAALFNGYVGANVAYAFMQTGLFTALAPGAHASLDELTAATRGARRRLQALLQTGQVFGYLLRDEQGRYAWTAAGVELGRHVGYFTWGVGGYGNVLRELGSLTLDDSKWYHLRDNGMVALGSDQVNRAFMRERIYSVLDQVKFSRIADLGCGNAGRLIEFCGRVPGTTGVGIDVSPEAISAARCNVEQHGFEQRITLHCENVLQAISDEQLKQSLRDVDLVSCFMMMHDLLNVDGLKDVLFDRLRAAFPSVKYFLIADTARHASPGPKDDLPIFSLGFELAHAFMDVQLHFRETYDEIFTRAGLAIEQCVDIGTPSTYLYLLRA
jgi:thioester reductase-like protein